MPGPLRSALRVWLPSRRLTPSEPVPVFFHTGGALGIRPSELPPPGRYPRVSARKNPLTVSPAGDPAAEAVGRPSGPRFLGFDPSRSPWQPDTWLARQLLAAPLGFALLGCSGERLARTFARAPPTRFNDPTIAAGPPAPRSLSALAWFRPPTRRTGHTHGTTLLGFSHRPSPSIRARLRPGYVFTSRRAVHCCRGPGDLWAVQPRSTGAARDTPQVPSTCDLNVAP